MRELKVIAFVLAVPLINIVLNTLVQATAQLGKPYFPSIFSWPFFAAYMVGTVSILTMLALYQTGVSLGSGILLMGAVSIVGGAVFGMLRDQQLLPVDELMLLGVIVILFSYRWLKSVF